jgi:CHAT domain-containing protein/tetratricopeptide (TPR) repeat protein
VLLWSGAPALAQAAPQASDPHPCSSSFSVPELLDQGGRLASREQNTAARACFELAISRSVIAGDRTAEAQAQLGLASAAFNLGDYGPASAAGVRAREIFKTSGDRLQAARAGAVLGSLARLKGDVPAARLEYQDALAVFEVSKADWDRASALINLAYAMPDVDPEAGRVLGEGLELARAMKSPGLEARALHLRGDRHFTAGRFDEAVADLGLAIRKFLEAGVQMDLADTYVSLGRVYRAHGQADRALALYERASEIQERIGALRGLVQSINARAVALNILGRLKEARTLYERALALARTTGSERIVNFQEGNLAQAYAAAGDRAGAIRLLEAVVMREKDSGTLAYRYGNLATYYLLDGKPDIALRYADQSIDHGLRAGNRDYLVALFQQRARIQQALGRLDLALANAREGIRRVEEIRTRLVPLDFMKGGFSDTHQAIFGLTLALIHESGDPEQALVVSEQGRARAFLDLLASRDLVEGSPAGLVSADAGKRETGLASYASSIPASAAEITAIAKRLDTTLLVYWVNDDETFAWVVRPGQPLRSVRIGVKRAALERAVHAALPTLNARGTAALGRLYRLLVSPVETWLPPAGSSLTIVPHGPLFRVSFAGLMDARGTYLVERYSIGYSPSTSAFMLTERLAGRAASSGTGQSLLVADPQLQPSSARHALPRLSASMREATAIQRVLGAGTTTILARGQALEPDVRRAVAEKRVLHFATHAVIRDDDPLESYLAVGRSGDDPASDGRLTVRELYDLTLSSELVVLSACRTATGRLSGDGMAGMARALFYAGTPTVVATLWDVADDPSAMLMAGFYSHWRGGMDKRAALRRAQLDLLRKLRSGSVVVRTPAGNVRLDARPFYWAGYVLIGEPF